MTKTPQRPRQPPARYSGIAAEPRLSEILADPIVRTLMARDGVGIGDIRYLAALLSDHRRPGESPAAVDASAPGAGNRIRA